MIKIITAATIAIAAMTAAAAAEDMKTVNQTFALETIYAAMDTKRADITVLVMAKAEAKIEARLAKIDNAWTAPQPTARDFMVASAK